MSEEKSYDNQVEGRVGDIIQPANQPSTIDKVAAKREYDRKWRAEHKASISAANKRWNERHPDYQKHYRAKAKMTLEECHAYYRQLHNQSKAEELRRLRENCAVTSIPMTIPPRYSVPRIIDVQKIPEYYYQVPLDAVAEPDFYERTRKNILRGISSKTLSKDEHEKWWNEFQGRCIAKYGTLDDFTRKIHHAEIARKYRTKHKEADEESGDGESIF